MKLLTIFSPTPGLNRFIQSTSELEQVSIRLNKYPGNIGRWRHLPDLKKQIVFTDTDDVIYQGGWKELEGIVTAPENVLHKDSMWKSFCVGEYTKLLDKPVYNAGLFSMPADSLREMVDFILRYKGNDQLSYNLWLLNQKHTPRLDVFLPLYDNLDKAKKVDNIWHYGKDIPWFVHANGNTKNLL
jgi:hypothetical protein